MIDPWSAFLGGLVGAAVVLWVRKAWLRLLQRLRQRRYVPKQRFNGSSDSWQPPGRVVIPMGKKPRG